MNPGSMHVGLIRTVHVQHQLKIREREEKKKKKPSPYYHNNRGGYMVNYTLVPIVPTRFQFGLQSFDLLVRILHFYFDVNNVVPLASPISTSNEEKTYSKLEGQKWNTKMETSHASFFPFAVLGR